MRLELEQAVELYELSVFRAAFYTCRDREEAEDVCQETFLAYFRNHDEFASREHVRAWLLRTAINKAKNATRSFWRRNREDLEDYAEDLTAAPEGDRDLLEAVMALPERCRVIIHLFYYEGYSVAEIAALLGVRTGTVTSQLHRGRVLLKERLQEEWEDD